MNTKHNSQDWKEEFRKNDFIFCDPNECVSFSYVNDTGGKRKPWREVCSCGAVEKEEKVLVFISSLLSSREKEIVEKIKNNLPKAEDQWLKVEKLRKDGDSIGFMLGWNEYEDELLKIIKK